MGLTEFLAKNKRTSKEVEYTISNDWLDENGKPIVFKLKAVPEKVDREIRESCMNIVTNKKGQIIKQSFDSSGYMIKLVAKSIIEPNLRDASLQDAYGVTNEWDLISEMLSSGEFANLFTKVQEINNFEPMDDLVEEAKN